jgi:hypothetical protein
MRPVASCCAPFNSLLHFPIFILAFDFLSLHTLGCDHSAVTTSSAHYEHKPRLCNCCRRHYNHIRFGQLSSSHHSTCEAYLSFNIKASYLSVSPSSSQIPRSVEPSGCACTTDLHCSEYYLPHLQSFHDAKVRSPYLPSFHDFRVRSPGRNSLVDQHDSSVCRSSSWFSGRPTGLVYEYIPASSPFSGDNVLWSHTLPCPCCRSLSTVFWPGSASELVCGYSKCAIILPELETNLA